MSKKKSGSAASKAARLFADRVSTNARDLSATTICDAILSARPQGTTGAEAFKWDYLRDEILSKYCDPRGDSQLRADKAVAKLLSSDRVCTDLNDHGIRAFNDNESIIYRARQIISDVLGDITLWRNDFLEHHAFSSGATVCRRRAYGDPYFKYDSTRPLAVTLRALPYAEIMIKATPLWDQPIVKLCRGNSVFTVPKASDIDRAACKEPGLNQVLQTSVGNFIRARLKLFGINLNDQSRNRRMARQGSLDGSFATIDLKSASDSISQRCIHELLETPWVALLDDLRSPEGQLPDGSWVTWAKHSTMGNGYTFELESLIFWALSRASIDIADLSEHSSYITNSNQVSIFGDDIIIPSAYYSKVVVTLNAFGFTVNEKKSFHEGPFRESCGGHYFNGHDVKPFYIRKPLDSPDRVIWLLNALRRWSSDDDGWCDPSIFPLWLKLKRKFVPPCFLGGRNLASISEVVSPEEPRYSLRWVLPNKEIDGPRAVLRWFQYNATRECLNSIRIKHNKELPRYIDRNSPASSKPVSFNHIMDLGSREKLRVKRYTPTLIESSIFPQEAVNMTAVNYRDHDLA